MDKKHPFVGLTLDEVFAAEQNLYTLQAGNDFYAYKGHYTFDKTSVEKAFYRILKQIEHHLNNGTQKERVVATNILNNLIIRPFRMH